MYALFKSCFITESKIKISNFNIGLFNLGMPCYKTYKGNSPPSAAGRQECSHFSSRIWR